MQRDIPAFGELPDFEKIRSAPEANPHKIQVSLTIYIITMGDGLVR